jgi:hypothetical protein
LKTYIRYLWLRSIDWQLDVCVLKLFFYSTEHSERIS